jgi:hypothetical protein
MPREHMRGVELHSFLTLALYGTEWSNSRPGRYIPVKESRLH